MKHIVLKGKLLLYCYFLHNKQVFASEKRKKLSSGTTSQYGVLQVQVLVAYLKKGE